MALIDTLLSSKRFTLKAADLSCGLKIKTFQLVPAALCHLFLFKLDVHLLGQKFKRSEGNKSPSIEPEIALFGDCTSMNLGPDECVLAVCISIYAGVCILRHVLCV